MKAAHHSGYHLTQKAWTDANKSTRQAMLKAAGHAPSAFYARVFCYLPSYVRNDLINAQARKSAAHARKELPVKSVGKPTQEPAKQFWWNND